MWVRLRQESRQLSALRVLSAYLLEMGMTAEDWYTLVQRAHAGDIIGIRELIFHDGKQCENARELWPAGEPLSGFSLLQVLVMSFRIPPLTRTERDSRFHDLITLIQELVRDCGADVNYFVDSFSPATPLHYACSQAACADDDNLLGYLAIAETLLEGGANIDPIGIYETPLARAMGDYFTPHTRSRAACVEFLLNRRANLNRAKACSKYGFPQWVKDLVQRRENARKATILVLGSRRFQRSTVLASNNMDVIRLIGKEIWRSRYDPAWPVNDIKPPK